MEAAAWLLRVGWTRWAGHMTHPPRSGLKMLSQRGSCSLPALAPVSTVAGGRKGILATYTLPLPWGQVSRDNRCHHSGKPAPGEALISPHLHSHSNRKQDSHCLISRGWAPATPAQGSARMTGHSSSLVPQTAGRSPSGAPCPAVRQVAGQVAGEAHLDVRHADSKQASWAVKGDSWVLYGGQSAPSCP